MPQGGCCSQVWRPPSHCCREKMPQLEQEVRGTEEQKASRGGMKQHGEGRGCSRKQASTRAQPDCSSSGLPLLVPTSSEGTRKKKDEA